MVGRIDGGGTPIQGSLGGANMDVVAENFRKMVGEAMQQTGGGSGLPVDQAKQITERINKYLEGTTSELRFEFHEKLNEYYVTIVDPKTHEVIKEIPSKNLMDAHAAMLELNGLFVNQKI